MPNLTAEEMHQQKLIRKADLFREVFENNPYGQRVLKALEEEFNHDSIFDLEPLLMAKKATERDVINYIKSLLEYDRVHEKSISIETITGG
jgi:hypothetical protein